MTEARRWARTDIPTHAEYAGEIVRLLASHNLSARVAAVKLLQGASGESIHALLGMAKAGARRAGIRRAIYYFACVLSTLLLFGIAATLMLDAIDLGPPLQVIFSISLAIATVQAPAEDEVAEALLRIDDARAVGPIAEALDTADTRWVAEEVLIRLLPFMRASDSDHLSEQQRASLYRNLRRRNTRFILACLESLRQIGDESALPHVRRLAENRGRGSNARHIREAAQDALPYIEARIERERNRRTLLRVAREPTDSLPRAAGEPTDCLLRPLRPSHEPPELMLRPHPSD